MGERGTSLDRLEDEHLSSRPPTARVGFLFGDCRVVVASNDAELIDRLAAYFAPFRGETDGPDLAITAVEMPEPRLDLPFRDWEREPGKTRRKDAFVDLPDGRVVRKVRTGMQFLVGPGRRVAFGPCLDNDNQVINFVISQYIAWLMHRGWLLCHAAAVSRGGRGLGVAATSGGGKSTLALHLLGRGFGYTSNDRLLVRREGDAALMNGVPKLPRINPGTALNNPRLRGILDRERREELEELPRDELWELEDKHDVDVAARFDAPYELRGTLEALVILDWSRDRDRPAILAPVDLAERPDLLAHVMKPPGPFYLGADGVPPPEPHRSPPAGYLEVLGAVPVHAMTGGVDFAEATRACEELLVAGSADAG